MKEEQSFCVTGTLSTGFDCGSKSRVSGASQAQSCSSCTTSPTGSPSLAHLLKSCQFCGCGRWDPGLWEKGLQALRKTYLWKAGWFPTHTFQHKQYFVHLGLIVSASVVDEDYRTLCWLSSKMQAAVVRNTKEWRTWQRCSWTVCYIWTMVWMKRALEIIEALSFPVQSMKNFPEQ